MTQRTIYALIFALGSLILTLPAFGNSPISIEISLSEVPDTTFLVPFKVSPTNKGILADWEELNEITDLVGLSEPVTRYELEYSKTGSDFSTIAILEPSEFSHLHYSPVLGFNYYRLKIHGSAGDFIYTDISLAEWDVATNNIFPNIVRTVAELRLASPVEEEVEVIIYDTHGRMVDFRHFELNESYTSVSLDFRKLHTGHYMAVVSGEQFGTEVIRFIKQ